MAQRIGIVMDPIASIRPYKDTTLAIMLEFQRRGHVLYYMQIQDLFLDEGAFPSATVQIVTVKDDPKHWFSLETKQTVRLNDLDVILMRKDPPVDMNFITATQLLEQASQQGVEVVNDPRSIRDCNEKIFATEFSQCQPPTLVTCNAERIRSFNEKYAEIILKPLHGMGGASVFHVSQGDPNLSVIIETLTGYGQQQVMAQRFVPEIKKGDKRILMINGEPIPYALARLPADGEIRANLASGGRGEGVELTDRDRWICKQVGPALKEKGLIFVGIDVIGDYLTEINVTSPTCVRELEALYSINICADIVDAILE